MRIIDRLLLITGYTGFVLLLLLWLLPVSRLAINPEAVRISPYGTVSIHRVFLSDRILLPCLRMYPDSFRSWLSCNEDNEPAYRPLPRPFISYKEYVKPLSFGTTNEGNWCQATGGPTRYISTESVGVWNISSWAQPCLDDPLGFEWEACWQWHLGALRLGPVCRSLVVLRDS